MEDMYNATINNNNNNATCSSSPHPQENETDDISLFVHQILRQTASCPPKNIQQSFDPFCSQHLYDPTRISVGGMPSFPGNVGSCSCVGPSDTNDFHEYDNENEVFGRLMEEAARTTKQKSSRNSSKRSREAQEHNLSEKRRRSRINEKMKALQNLIPNSNKTDKASMLDEAIEYIKHLQLQVQILTMRNGLSLYPTCLPGVMQQNQLSQIRTASPEGNGPLKLSSTPPIDLETLSNLNLLNQCNKLNQPLPHVMGNARPSFRLESSAEAQHRPCGLHTGSKEICREGMHFQSMNVEHCKTNYASGSKDTALDTTRHTRC